MGYLVPDLHGSVVATEAAGSSAIASALRYDGYGRTAAVALPGGTVALDTRYTGALDLSPDATPLYDIGARFYSPASGAWTSLDTYGGQAQNPASMNRFLYAHANPTTFIDPTGHFIKEADERVPTPEAKQRIQDNIEQHGNANGSTGGGGGGGGADPPKGPISTVPTVSDERFTHIGDIRLGWWGGPTSMADLDQLGIWCTVQYLEGACDAYLVGLATVPEDPEFIHSLLDAAGIVDPTPLSDGLNAGLYTAKGDPVNAGVSGLGAAGWFVTDVGKIPRLAGKVVDALKSIGKRVDNLPLGTSLPTELTLGRNADLGVDVYVGRKDGREVYVGITNDIARRQGEHGARFTIDPISTASARPRATMVRRWSGVRHG